MEWHDTSVQKFLVVIAQEVEFGQVGFEPTTSLSSAKGRKGQYSLQVTPPVW